MKKVVRNGKVAIILYRGFGAGWSTWEKKHPECLYDPDIVAAIEKSEDLKSLITKKYPTFLPQEDYHNLAIEWVKLGVKFRVVEQGGNEQLDYYNERDWEIA